MEISKQLKADIDNNQVMLKTAIRNHQVSFLHWRSWAFVAHTSSMPCGLIVWIEMRWSDGCVLRDHKETFVAHSKIVVLEKLLAILRKFLMPVFFCFL